MKLRSGSINILIGGKEHWLVQNSTVQEEEKNLLQEYILMPEQVRLRLIKEILTITSVLETLKVIVRQPLVATGDG